MFKQKVISKSLFLDNKAEDTITILKDLFTTLNESYQSENEDLPMQCAQILVLLCHLNNRKYYIPGETSEKAKLRQRAMDYGIFVVLLNVALNSTSDQLKQYL